MHETSACILINLHASIINTQDTKKLKITGSFTVQNCKTPTTYIRLESVKHTIEPLPLKILETGICAYHILPPSTCPQICNSNSYALR